MKILVTGANGYVGRAIIKNLNQNPHAYQVSTITRRRDVDLTDSRQVDEYFLFKTFDVVIHCAVQGGHRLQPESMDMLDANLQMYYNLLKHQDKFKRFIHIGSGAELNALHTPYGLSKHLIKSSMSEKDGFYNLRVFGLFDENELDTRFIKSNIKRYIDRQPIEVYQTHKMDFIYMPDFLRIVEEYITNNDWLPKEINCCYKEKYNLLAIATKISKLADYAVKVDVTEFYIPRDYIGEYDQWLDKFNFIGLDNGIREVYEKLKA